jgi:UDP-N-acetylmuramoylalanine--D-glutamate ligase
MFRMQDYLDYFKGKKATQMGLGLLGRGVGDAEFLARLGVDLTVTDLKSEKDLAPSLARLKDFKNIKFVLGEHRLEDFSAKGGSAFGGRGPDFILKAAGVPLDSPYIAEAKKNGIPIEMDASLFFKLAPKHDFIGITGTRGKSTTTFLLFSLLERAGKRTFLAGNIKDVATLPLLEKVREGDSVVAELDSWQLQGFGESKISPPYSIFTTFMPDHMNYYKGDMGTYFHDKENIYKYQKSNDVLVVGEDIAEKIGKNVPGKVVIAKRSIIPKSWLLRLPGEHNRLNIACAVSMAEVLGVPRKVAESVIREEFPTVIGRLQPVKSVGGVTIYNDNNATTPDATIAGLQAIALGKNIILIMGGTDKGLDMEPLIQEIPKHCRAVVLLKETGTDKIRERMYSLVSDGVAVKEEGDLEACLKTALSLAKRSDIVLFSPAFASFGKLFKNEYDRGAQFLDCASRVG